MRLDHTRIKRWAIALLTSAMSFCSVALAQPFSDLIKISSKFETLQAAIDATGPGGMLIVDRAYTNLSPLVLPSRFRMVGLGPQGHASLSFETLANGSSAITIPAGASYVVIEDLAISSTPVENPSCDEANRLYVPRIGVDLKGASFVSLSRVVIRGFDVGISGSKSESVSVYNSNVSLNSIDNYRITDGSNNWRVHGGTSSQSGCHAFHIHGVNDTLIDGVRMESNSVAAVLTDASLTRIANNRFECWVHPDLPYCLSTTNAVIIGPLATQTTLIDNYYSGIEVVDQSLARTTYRLDNGYALEISPPSGSDALTVRHPGSTSPVFEVDDAARVRIGTEQGAAAKLTVNADAGEDSLRVRSGGTTQLIVNGSGRLGVGTSVPSAQLAVNASSAEDALRVQTWGSTDPRLLVDRDGRVSVGTAAGPLGWLTVNSPNGEGPLLVRSAGVTRMQVTSDGKVGIGSITPGARLQVGGGDAYVSSLGSGVILRSPNGSCFRLTVSNAGNVVSAGVACPL